MKQSKILKLILGGVFVLFLFSILNVELASAQSSCSDQITGVDRYKSCRVNAGESLYIPAEGCDIPFFQLNNNTTKDMFIPTNNCTEISSVVVHLPNNASATISSGLSSGEETFTDPRDGQAYPAIEIGNQLWMAKNLNYVLNDGTGSWCYNNNTANCNTYGRLYNWSTATSACPSGWKLPTDAELHILENYLSTGSCDPSRSNSYGCDPAGAALRSGGYSGFNALMSGRRTNDGSFNLLSYQTEFWSSTESDSNAWFRYLNDVNSTVGRYITSKDYGFPVRCLKNNPVIKNGNFESGNTSWWNTQGNVSVSGNYANSGNYSARVYSISSAGEKNTSKLTQTVDLTNKDYLKFNYRYSGNTSCLGQGGTMYMRVKIDGGVTTLLSEGGTCTSHVIDWTERIIDVSSFSGNKLIEFEVQTIGRSLDGSGCSIAIMIDEIELLNRVSPTISLSGATKTYGDSAFTITHSTNSTGAKSFSSSNTSVATINSSGVVTITGAGTTTITFNVGSSANYNASSATATLTVNKATPTCSISPTTKTYGNAAYTVTNSTTSNGTKSFSSNNTGVASINSSTGSITIGNAGSATITMSVAAATNYNAISCTGTQIVDKATHPTPSGPTVAGRTVSSIMLNDCPSVWGCEYRMNSGTWQTSTYFSGLASATQYTFTQRIIATANYNASSESVGNNFSTAVVPWSCGSNFIDIRDGKSYPTKQFGSQCWMTKNLNYDVATSHCYGSNSLNCVNYGRLYTLSTALRACPAGWHLPSDGEFTTLEGTIGSARTIWMDTNGWAGQYGGWLYNNRFNYLGSYGFWWSSTPYSSDYWTRVLYSAVNVYRAPYLPAATNNFSVRCIKDAEDGSANLAHQNLGGTCVDSHACATGSCWDVVNGTNSCYQQRDTLTTLTRTWTAPKYIAKIEWSAGGTVNQRLWYLDVYDGTKWITVDQVITGTSELRTVYTGYDISAIRIRRAISVNWHSYYTLRAFGL